VRCFISDSSRSVPGFQQYHNRSQNQNTDRDQRAIFQVGLRATGGAVPAAGDRVAARESVRTQRFVPVSGKQPPAWSEATEAMTGGPDGTDVRQSSRALLRGGAEKGV
jgi:hypothetical protein